MESNKTTSQVRISKQAKEKLSEQSHRTGLTSAELIDQYLGLSANSRDTKTPVAKIRRQKINQPPQALVDAYIMNLWEVKHYAKYAEQDHKKSGLSMHDWVQQLVTGQRTYEVGEELNQSLSRSYLIERTYESLTDKGWHTIYPDWFSSHKEHHGDFQSLIDRRLKALVNLGFLTRSEGIYKLAKALTPDVIDSITGIVALVPQKGLKITKLVKKPLEDYLLKEDYLLNISESAIEQIKDSQL